MTNDVQELVRRAFDQIIDATGNLGPCPSSNDELPRLRTHPSASVRGSRHDARHSRQGVRRLVAVGSGLLVTLGFGAVLWVTQRPGTAPEPATGNPPPTPTYLGTDLDLSLPIVGRAWGDSMDFALSRNTNARLYNVWQAAITSCMKSSGYPDYKPVPYPANGSYEDLINPLDRRYAAVMGYHALPADPIDPNTYTEASRGQAAHCANDVDASTWGRVSAYTSINDQLRTSLSAAIAGFADSDEGRAATARWASCMSGRGHKFESRSDAIRIFAERPTVSADEITTRLDDLACDATVGYTQTQHDWEQRQVTVWRGVHRDMIATAIEQKRVVDERLAEIETSQRSTGN